MINETLQVLREQGYRITRIRKAVLEVLAMEAKPLSVDGIIKKLGQKKLYPNKTTVYRELGVLVLGSFVKEIQIGTRSRMYEVASLGHHHHLVCTKCEMIEDVSIKNEMVVFEKNIIKKTSFRILDHSLEFFGLCAKCQ